MLGLVKRGGQEEGIGQRGRCRWMIDNLLLADVSDLLGALLLEGLLLHGLVAVLAPDTSMIIDL